MKAIELRKKSVDELRSLLRDKLLQREGIALALAQKKAKNVKELRFLKKDIARIKTIMQSQH